MTMFLLETIYNSFNSLYSWVSIIRESKNFIEEISKIAHVDKTNNLRFEAGNSNYKFDVIIKEDKYGIEINLLNKVNNIPFLRIILNKNIKMQEDEKNFFNVVTYNFKDNLKWIYNKLNNIFGL